MKAKYKAGDTVISHDEKYKLEVIEVLEKCYIVKKLNYDCVGETFQTSEFGEGFETLTRVLTPLEKLL